MKIISFAGVDGSGKTTQRELLQEYLEQNGYRVSYFHATEFSLANRLQRKLQKKEGFVPGQERAVTKASFFAVLLRLFFLALDGIRFHNYERCLTHAGFTVLVSDRFFQDSLLNAAYLSKNVFIRGLIRFLGNALPVPEHTFYLQLSAEDVLSRESVPEQGRAYLEEKIRLYNAPPFDWTPHIIDAAESPGSIHQAVVGHLGNL